MKYLHKEINQNFMQMRSKTCAYRVLLSFLLLFVIVPAFAQTIKGKVFDSHTGEPLVGANVVLQQTHYTTTVQLDGSFTFKHVPAGKYNVVVSTIGYSPSKPVEVVAGGSDLNISMTQTSTTM